MKGFMCVIPGCTGLSSSDACLQGSIGILSISLGFARCFCKPSSIFASQFRNLKAFSMLGGDFAAILKFGDHFAEKWHFRRPFLKLGAFSQRGVDFVEEGNSRSPFRSLKVISQLKGDFTGVSQLQNEGNCAAKWHSCAKSGFAAAKHPSKWRLGCEIPVQLCALVFKWP